MFVIILVLLLHALPTPNFCPYSQTATEHTVAFDSSPTDLAAYQHTQDLLNNFKRHIAAFHRRMRAGSKATLWLSDHICAVSSKRSEAECNCEIINIFFNGITHYLSLLDSVMQRQRIFPLCIS